MHIANMSTVLKNKHTYQDDCGDHSRHQRPNILLAFCDLCAKHKTSVDRITPCTTPSYI